jgi:hypothetical protein
VLCLLSLVSWWRESPMVAFGLRTVVGTNGDSGVRTVGAGLVHQWSGEVMRYPMSWRQNSYSVNFEPPWVWYRR